MTKRVEGSATYSQTWDVENRLTVVTNTVSGAVTRFYYDGDGQRVKKVDPTGTTAYAGAVEVAITGTLRITKTYYSATGLVAMRVVTSTGGNTLHYLHSDHLGSTSLTTDSGGNVTARQTYYPFGATRPGGVGTLPTDIAFTGQRSESGLGSLYFYQARFYSPAVGRFLSADTIVPEARNPQSLNRYNYVLGNPLKYTDPSGHREIECDPGTPGCDLNGRQTTPYDLTSYLARAMTAHGEDPRLKHIADGINPEMGYMTLGGDGGLAWLGYRAGRGGGAYTQFLELEGTKKEWDIKQRILQDLRQGVILCGEVCDWYDYSTPGNIHFGYAAGRAGIDHGIAAAAGGLEELKDRWSEGKPHPYCPICDDPQDQAAVDFGYYLAGKYPNGITVANLRKELTVSWTSQFQRPIDPTFQPPYPATPGVNHYGPDRFNWP